MDNAPSHPSTLEFEGVQIEFLPPNTTSLIQPLDQGIISTFKSYYIKHALRKIIDFIDENKDSTGLQAWKSLTLLDCLNFIQASLKEMKQSTLAGCWKPLLPNLVVIDPNEDLIGTAVNEELVSMGKSLSRSTKINADNIREVR